MFTYEAYFLINCEQVGYPQTNFKMCLVQQCLTFSATADWVPVTRVNIITFVLKVIVGLIY